MSYWFKGQELGFALGVSSTLSRIASVMNSNITPTIYDNTNGFFWSFFIGLIFLFLSLICCIIFNIIDKITEVKAIWKKFC